MATSMDDILSDKPVEKNEERPEVEPKEPAAAKADKPEAQERERDEKQEKVSSKRKEHQRKEWEAQGRDPETGQFRPKAEVKEDEKKDEPKAAEKKADEPAKTDGKKEEKPAASAQPEMTPREKAYLKGLEEERRKRQALEQELARRAAPAAQPAAAAPGQQPKKTFWDDPEGALAAHRQHQEIQGVRQRIATSEMIARSRHQDFDDKVAKFHQLAQQVPGLAQQMAAAPDPAEFAYQAAKNHILLEQAGSLDKVRADIEAKARADERAKLEAEFKAKEEEKERQRKALPTSLTDVHGTGRKPTPQWTGPTPMTDILGR